VRRETVPRHIKVSQRSPIQNLPSYTAWFLTVSMSGEESLKEDKQDESGKKGANVAGTKRSRQEKAMSELSADDHDDDHDHDLDHEDDDVDEDDADEFNLDPEKRKEVRKMRRVMANRRSARESRERRKKLLTDLQESVESLSSENANLSKENMALRQELATLMEQSGGSASLGMLGNSQVII
jgi:bZIP transcription factor